MIHFICPLPWISLSLGAKSSPRVCCHQTCSNDLITPYDSLSDALSLKHNEHIKMQMLKGEIPSECVSCFEQETNNITSPRQEFLSIFPINDALRGSNLHYLDITSDNICNLECIMCSPNFSYKLDPLFISDFNKNPTNKWTMKYSQAEFETILPKIKMLTIRGGELFLSQSSMKFLHHVSNLPSAKNITLRIFSNLTYLPQGIEVVLNKFKNTEFNISIDSINENYNFIRYPSKWEKITKNLTHLKKISFTNVEFRIQAVMMATNWKYLGELILFYRDQNLNPSFILPIFNEIEVPELLHPRVLLESEFTEGEENIYKALYSLHPTTSSHLDQITDFKNKIQKIKSQSKVHLYFEYRSYVAKIKRYRKK